MKTVLVIALLSLPLFGETPNTGLEDSLRCIFSDDLGYTLIGEKAVSLDDATSLDFEYHPEKKVIAHRFLSKVFKGSRKFVYIPNGEDSGWLIHRDALSKEIANNRKLEDFILLRYASEGAFFDTLETTDRSIFDLLEFDPVLIAIALGYGENNGEFYSRWLVLAEYLQKYPVVSYFPFQFLPDAGYIRHHRLFCDSGFRSIPRPNIRLPWRSLEEEWQWMMQLDWQLSKESYPPPPYFISLPAYKSCRGPESERLHLKYLKARERLARLFCEKNFAEVIADEAAKK
jgi:hypothetical protein